MVKTSKHLPVVLCLMGPTASGKTDCAMAVANEIDSQLISVDSALVYKTMDIGSGKPSADELKQYPHELIDLVYPHEPYSAYEFQQDAQAAIDKALKSNKLPILVGGTMLYFKALLDGFANLPKASPDIRAKIESQALEHGWPAMHQTLSLVDAATAARLEPNDSQRISRALEVFYSSGIPLSKLIKSQVKPKLSFNPICVGIAPLENNRQQLHRRIEKRFEHMLAQGLVEEVQRLMKDEHFDRALPAFKSVGYRQVIEFLDGKMSQEQLYEKGCSATRQLAKRQLTWLRSWENLHMLDCFDKSLIKQVLDLLKK